MGRLHLIILTVCGIAASAAAGDLWINCDAGFEVSVDGKSVGACEGANSELRVIGLETGDHLIRVEDTSGATADFPIPLGRASTQAVIPELVLSMEGGLPTSKEAEGSAPAVGIVEITSNPKNCDIEFVGREISKRQPIVVFLGIPVGEYDIRFSGSEVKLNASQSPHRM